MTGLAALGDVFADRTCRRILRSLHQRYVDAPKVMTVGSGPERRAARILERASLLHHADRSDVTWELTELGQRIAYHFTAWRAAQGDDSVIQKLDRSAPGKPLRVLDVACGSGGTVYSVASRVGASGVGMDLDVDAVLLGKSIQRTLPRGDGACPLIAADAHALPFATGTFDVVLCRDALQYLDVRVALSEIARVARDDAYLYFLVHAPGFYLDQITSRGRATLRTDGFALANAIALSLLRRQMALRRPSGRTVRTCAFTPRTIRRLLAADGIRVRKCEAKGSRWGFPLFLEISAHRTERRRS